MHTGVYAAIAAACAFAIVIGLMLLVLTGHAPRSLESRYARVVRRLQCTKMGKGRQPLPNLAPPAAELDAAQA